MPLPEDLAPHFPHEGPPVPRALPGWPTTPEEVQKAVWEYAWSAEKAIDNYRRSWERAIYHYREELLRRLP